MTPEAQDILKEITYKLRDTVLADKAAEHPGFYRTHSKTLDVTIDYVIPEKDKDNWLQALNALSSHDVSTYALYDNIDEVGDYIDNNLCCVISDIDPKKLIYFCNSFGINLKIHPNRHTAKLAISPENELIICVDNKTRYELPPLHDSTFVRMLKIAFQPSLQGIPLTIAQLNKEGSDKEIVSRVLGGKVLKIGASIKRLKIYRYNVEIPEFLDKFYILIDNTITSRPQITIDDKTLEEIKNLAEYSSPIKRARK